MNVNEFDPIPDSFFRGVIGMLISMSVLKDIGEERARQNDKWGEQNHTDEWWLAIISEELGEVSQAILHNKFGGKAKGTMREELVQVAAVAIQWLECIDRNGGEKVTEAEDYASE